MDFDANENGKTSAVAVATVRSSSPISQKRAARPKAGNGRSCKKAKKTIPPLPQGGDDDDDDDDDEHDEVDIFDNVDIAAHIFEFLHIKELFRFVFSSKAIMQRLTYRNVIRSALVNGCFAQTTIGRLIPAIRTRSIWIPSPVRMLRLVNGKRCERCNEKRTNFCSEDFGVFFCWNGCLAEHLKGVRYNSKWSPFLNEPRIATSEYGRIYNNKAYIWRKPAKDLKGDPIGPLICKQQMEEVMKKKSPTSVESLLQATDAVDPHAGDVETIVKEYTEFLATAQRRAHERAVQKTERCKNNNETRKVKTEAFMEKLSELLGDVPWKSTVLGYYYMASAEYSARKVVAHFRCKFVADLLDPLAAAPSKATNKKLREVADVISEAFNAVWSSNFYNFSWLAESQVAYEQILYSYCVETFSTRTVLQDIVSEQVELIRNGRLLEAVHIFVPEFKIVDLVQPSIVSTAGSIEEFAKHGSKELCRRLWEEKRRGPVAVFCAIPIAECADAYEQCLADFPTLHQNVLDFLQDPETEAWKEKEEGKYAAEVNMVWDRVEISLIRNRDFPGIRVAIETTLRWGTS